MYRDKSRPGKGGCDRGAIPNAAGDLWEIGTGPSGGGSNEAVGAWETSGGVWPPCECGFCEFTLDWLESMT